MAQSGRDRETVERRLRRAAEIDGQLFDRGKLVLKPAGVAVSSDAEGRFRQTGLPPADCFLEIVQKEQEVRPLPPHEIKGKLRGATPEVVVMLVPKGRPEYSPSAAEVARKTGEVSMLAPATEFAQTSIPKLPEQYSTREILFNGGTFSFKGLAPGGCRIFAVNAASSSASSAGPKSTPSPNPNPPYFFLLFSRLTAGPPPSLSTVSLSCRE